MGSPDRLLLGGAALALVAAFFWPRDAAAQEGPSGLPHTSLEGCEDSIEWVTLPALPSGEVWQVSADAPWRSEQGLERFRPTPSWDDAVTFAASLGAQLVTAELSDLAWAEANVRLTPHPLGDRSTPEASAETDRQMMGAEFALEENRKIEAERAGRGGLCSTVGKDYVIDARNAPGRCSIYGWHRASGAAIQPVSNAHEAEYHDYSHHPRLARRIA